MSSDSTTVEQFKALGEAAVRAGEAMRRSAASLGAFSKAFEDAAKRDLARRAEWRRANNCQTVRERLADAGWEHRGLPQGWSDVKR